MPANEFEKQVQQKMDEFRLEPSAAVWQKVEEEIRKKKRRRIIFFFILPAAIALLGSSVYFFINDHSNHNLAKQPAIVNEKKTGSTTANDNNVHLNEQQLKNSNTEPAPGSDKTVVSKNNTPTQSNTVVSANKEQTTIDPVVTKPSGKLLNSAAARKSIVKKSKAKVEEESSLTINTENPNKKSINKPVMDDESKAEKQTAEPVIAMEANENRNNDPVAVAEQNNIAESKTDTVVKIEEVKTEELKETAAKKKTGKSKLKWGIDLSAGLSGTNENVFDLNFQKSFSDALNATSGSSTGAPPVAISPPSSIGNSFAFKTGFAAEVQVSKRSRFSAGLQYAFLSNKIKAGRRWDSTLNFYNSYSPAQIAGYYGGVRQSIHTNKFHFIQLPLYYHWQLNKGKKLPLQWNIGMTPGYLAGNNGLVYDTSYGGVYYSRKKAFNKFHLNIGTGLSARVKGKSGTEWIFGPEVSFDLNRLINNPFDRKQYLFFGGINARFLFPQKKK